MKTGFLSDFAFHVAGMQRRTERGAATGAVSDTAVVVRPYSRKNERQQKIAAGFCSRCGKKPHAENRKLCVVCLKISLNNTHRRLAENPNLSKEARRKLFLECLDAYGGRKCACCGVDEILFLSLDHINNDGAAHRKSMGQTKRKAGEYVWFWLKKHKFPPGMQVLCMNCNTGKQRNGGICPHKVLVTFNGEPVAFLRDN